jgi:hypothetical protein
MVDVIHLAASLLWTSGEILTAIISQMLLQLINIVVKVQIMAQKQLATPVLTQLWRTLYQPSTQTALLKHIHLNMERIMPTRNTVLHQ